MTIVSCDGPDDTPETQRTSVSPNFISDFFLIRCRAIPSPIGNPYVMSQSSYRPTTTTRYNFYGHQLSQWWPWWPCYQSGLVNVLVALKLYYAYVLKTCNFVYEQDRRNVLVVSSDNRRPGQYFSFDLKLYNSLFSKVFNGIPDFNISIIVVTLKYFYRAAL